MLHRNSLGKCDLWVPHALDVTEATQAISDTDPLKSANSVCSALQKRKTGEIVSERMAATHNKSGLRGHALSRRIIVVVVPPVDELDLVGPLQVFSSVNRLSSRNIYAIEVVTNTDRLTVEGEAGVLTFLAKHHFSKVEGTCDSVLLVCGLGSRSVRGAALSSWLKKKAMEVRRLGAVCVGAFLLAEAGLLNDRRATTHWGFGREMATLYPSVRVQHDPLWVRGGNIYTSAGISAGIDLALAWVEEDCGAGLAHEAARELVLFLRRPGGQPQLSVSLASQASEMMSIRELQIWIAEHLQTKLSIEDLADRMSMSVRNFERIFTREVGTTPSQYVLQTRVEAARRQLEYSERGLKQVASAAGFGNVDLMRRAFVRVLGITPRRYRELAEQSTAES
jgi:transcriptional regulator GlxA family with amidase domain